MTLASAISGATHHELEGLAAYVSGEIEMEGLDVAERKQVEVDPASIIAAMRAWAYMQQNQAGRDD